MEKTNEKMLREFRDQIRNWFWTYGVRRKGSYALPPADWFYKMETKLSKWIEIEKSKEIYAGKTVALWGPSQSGKSTMLAPLIDYDFEKTGGALFGDENKKIRFSGLNNDQEALNPYNHRSDASGCVTRFVLKEKVEIPEAPVEVEFAKESDVMMSLAFGYLAEVEKPNGGKSWRSGDIESILKKISEKEVECDIGKQKILYEKLCSFLDVLESLVLGGNERYRSLSNDWTRLRQTILSYGVLVCSQEIFEDFIFEVLWDKNSVLTEEYKKLLKTGDLIRTKIGEKVYCSLEVAALFLDISVPEKINQSTIQSKIENIRLLSNGEKKYLIMSEENLGEKIFGGEIKFGYCQGLAWSLILPLKRERIKAANGQLFDLLEKSDIVDFPGVANEEDATKGIGINEEDLKDNRVKVLTKVLKRGKTASIVISYSKNLNIDVFSILNRANFYPRKIDQLKSGIDSWRRFIESGSKKMPINIILTFFGEIVKEVHHKYDEDGMRSILEDRLEKLLNGLGDPEDVNFFSVYYEQYEGSVIKDLSPDERVGLLNKIKNDKYYKKYFSRTLPAVEKAFEENGAGGRVYLFEELLKQVEKSKRPLLLEELEKKIEDDVCRLLREALPPEGDITAERERSLQKIIERVKEISRDEERSREFSKVINRGLLNINVKTLNRGPSRKERIKAYSQDVYEKIRSQICSTIPDWFIGDENERALFSKYWAERVNSQKIDEWLQDQFMPTFDWRDKILERLAFWAFRRLTETTQNSFNEIRNHTVRYFAEILESLKNEQFTERGHQIGDEELKSIEKFLNINK